MNFDSYNEAKRDVVRTTTNRLVSGDVVQFGNIGLGFKYRTVAEVIRFEGSSQMKIIFTDGIKLGYGKTAIQYIAAN